MKIENIIENWKEDCKINKDILDRESMDIAVLHNKYYIFLMEERLTLKKYEQEYNKLRLDKWEYYNGSISEEKLTERNWEPCQLKILKSESNMYIDADDDIINMRNKIDFQKEKVEYVTAIVDRINHRGFQIKNAIDFIKYLNAQV